MFTFTRKGERYVESHASIRLRTVLVSLTVKSGSILLLGSPVVVALRKLSCPAVVNASTRSSNR